MARVPEHALLDGDGDDGGNERDHAGDGQALVVARKDLLEADPADANTRHQQNEAERNGGEALDALVTVGVRCVCGATAEAHADKGDDGREDVRERVDGIGYHGARITDNACEELERR